MIANHLAELRPECRVVIEPGIQPKVHTAEVRIDLLRREADGSWPDNPTPLRLAESVTLESIDFTAPVATFYRTA